MRPYYGEKNDSPPHCWDPPATSSHARKCKTVGTHLVEAYVVLSFWSRTCTYILVDVEARTCHSRAPHVAVQAVPSKPCTRTYSHTPKNTATYVHTGGVSNAYSRIRTARAHVHGWVGTEKQRRRRVHGEATECVVFIGRQRNVCCSSGANRLGQNSRWKRGLAYRRTEETALCSTGHGRKGILFIRRGLAYHKTEETDFSWSKRGPVDREGCGVP